MLGNAQEMQIGPVVENRAAGRDADAPPRLRISVKRPLAALTRSGESPPRASVTVDAMANGVAKPRNASGHSISSQPH